MATKPKKAARRILRKADAVLRRAEAEAEAIHAAARIEATRRRELADAEGRVIVAEATVRAERVVRDAEGEADALRREAMLERERALRAATDERVRLRDDAMLEAARIREAATQEIVAFVNSLNAEREKILVGAHVEARRIIDAAREAADAEAMRTLTATDAGLEDQTRRILDVAVEEGERILREAEAERAGTSAVRVREATRPAEPRLSWTCEAATATVLAQPPPTTPEPAARALSRTLEEPRPAEAAEPAEPASPTDPAPTDGMIKPHRRRWFRRRKD
jgi:cell division septum initiation protein DivIVA